jgi:DNA repair protein RecO (recombination protein O)
MSSEKSQAIVLRVTEFSETSCVVTLFTREFGKITALAKGARKRKSPFEAAIDVLAICRIVFLHKSSNAMDLLTEAKLERRFRSASADLSRLYSAYYVIELLRNLTEENDPHTELFDEAIRIIVDLDDSTWEPAEMKLELLKFEIRMLELLGHFPMLDRCVGCGRERKSDTRVSFGLNAGGLICRSCRPGKSSLVIASPESIQLLRGLRKERTAQKRFMQKESSDDTTSRLKPNTEELVSPEEIASWSQSVREESVCQFEPNRASLSHQVKDSTDLDTLNEARRLMTNYITHLQGFPPRLHKFLKNL